MNINPISYRLSSASYRGQMNPSFCGSKKAKGPVLPHNLEPSTNQSKRQEMLSQYIAMLSMCGCMISLNQGIHLTNADNECIVVTPEQSSFDTREGAIEYAKKKITDALKEPRPYEYCVIIDNNNNIINEFKGDSTEVNSFYKKTDYLKTLFSDYSVTTLHGHPDNNENVTTPISFSDFETLNSSPFEKESIVYNKNGEYSILKKTDKFVPLDEEEIELLRQVYSFKMLEAFKKNHPEKVLQRQLNMNFSTSHNAKKNIENNYYSEINKFQINMQGIKIIDSFWKEFAPRLGFEYKTNYSYLKQTLE